MHNLGYYSAPTYEHTSSSLQKGIPVSSCPRKLLKILSCPFFKAREVSLWPPPIREGLHCWLLELDHSLLGEVFPFTGTCLAASLVPAHETPVQFSSVAQSCLTFCHPMNRSTPDLPVHHKLPEFTQTHAHRVGDAIQPSHPLSSPSPPTPSPSQHQGLFQ